MNKMTDIGSVPTPTRSPSEFLAYERGGRGPWRPLQGGRGDGAKSGARSRRTAASTLMFLAAQHVSAASETSTVE